MFTISPLAAVAICGESVRMSTELTEKSVLGAWLLERREACGMSQVQAGQAMGVDSREIRRWESGEVPGGLTLIRLLNTYGVRVDPAPPEELPAAVNAELHALRSAVVDLGRRFARLEGRAERQGKAATQTLEGLEADVARIRELLDVLAPPANRQREAR